MSSTKRCNATSLMRLIMLLGAVSLVNQTALAQDNCGCEAALRKDFLSTVVTDQQKYSYFSQIDQKTFEQLKVDVSAGASIPIPLLGDMIDIIRASANYNQFAEKRTEYFERIGYTSDKFREERDTKIVTAPIAYRAWSECMRDCMRTRRGLFVWKESEDEQSVKVRITSNLPIRVRLISRLLNGVVRGAPANKAFADGKRLSGGGEIPVLIERQPGKKVHLTIEANPQIPAGFVESEWGAAPTDQGRGTLELVYETTRIQERGTIRGETKTVPNNHNEDCDDNPVCSTDRRWRAAWTVLRVVANQGRLVRNPRIACSRDNDGACRFVERLSYDLSNGNREALASFTTHSRDCDFSIYADEYEIESIPQPEPSTLILFKDSQFDFKVPKRARSASLRYQFGNTSGVITPGAAQSPDGLLVKISSVDAVDSTYYVYRVNH